MSATDGESLSPHVVGIFNGVCTNREDSFRTGLGEKSMLRVLLCVGRRIMGDGRAACRYLRISPCLSGSGSRGSTNSEHSGARNEKHACIEQVVQANRGSGNHGGKHGIGWAACALLHPASSGLEELQQLAARGVSRRCQTLYCALHTWKWKTCLAERE